MPVNGFRFGYAARLLFRKHRLRFRLALRRSLFLKHGHACHICRGHMLFRHGRVHLLLNRRCNRLRLCLRHLCLHGRRCLHRRLSGRHLHGRLYRSRNRNLRLYTSGQNHVGNRLLRLGSRRRRGRQKRLFFLFFGRKQIFENSSAGFACFRFLLRGGRRSAHTGLYRTGDSRRHCINRRLNRTPVHGRLLK